MQKERQLSQALYAKCCDVMPAGVSSPVRAFKGLNRSPLIVTQGKGDILTDVEGDTYIDFCMAWGSLLLGHSPVCVVEALTKQLSCGTSFGIATMYEEQLAQKIRSHMPSVQKLRFVLSGTEATMTAIRLARAFTEKSTILKFDGHYHGHSDSLLISAGSGVTHLPQASSRGIPRDVMEKTASLPFNDCETFLSFLNKNSDVAAVIIEPVAANMGVVPATQEFIDLLREETKKRGIVLIMDEVVNGFRLGLGGAQAMYGIEGDLTCLGKVIGGGLPIAAVGGKKEIIDLLAPLGSVYQAGTLSGNPLAMLAGKAVLEVAELPGFYDTLNTRLETFLEPIRKEIANRDLPIAVQSAGSMFSLFFGLNKVASKADCANMDEELFKQFFYFLFDRGVYISPSAYEAHFLSPAHTEDHLNYVQSLICEFIKEHCYNKALQYS